MENYKSITNGDITSFLENGKTVSIRNKPVARRASMPCVLPLVKKDDDSVYQLEEISDISVTVSRVHRTSIISGLKKNEISILDKPSPLIKQARSVLKSLEQQRSREKSQTERQGNYPALFPITNQPTTIYSPEFENNLEMQVPDKISKGRINGRRSSTGTLSDIVNEESKPLCSIKPGKQTWDKLLQKLKSCDKEDTTAKDTKIKTPLSALPKKDHPPDTNLTFNDVSKLKMRGRRASMPISLSQNISVSSAAEMWNNSLEKKLNKRPIWKENGIIQRSKLRHSCNVPILERDSDTEIKDETKSFIDNETSSLSGHLKQTISEISSLSGLSASSELTFTQDMPEENNQETNGTKSRSVLSILSDCNLEQETTDENKRETTIIAHTSESESPASCGQTNQDINLQNKQNNKSSSIMSQNDFQTTPSLEYFQKTQHTENSNNLKPLPERMTPTSDLMTKSEPHKEIQLKESHTSRVMEHRRVVRKPSIEDIIPHLGKHSKSASFIPRNSEKRLHQRRNSAYLIHKFLADIRDSLSTETLLEIEKLKKEKK